MQKDKEDEKIKWYLKPVSVVILLFFVLGPLALPLLYKSPKFNKTFKIILTIIVILYTAYFIFVSLEIANKIYRGTEELQNILK
ncbi:MAG: hypothetical protein HYY56_04220 [Candidatus Omnitrophica bacterium]|nr:hypothetical protein [Candidatus Omnitrophota bacterium]